RHLLKGASTMRTFRRCAGMAIAAGALLVGGCSNWLSVDNPGVIDQGALDPVADAPTLAKSAQQNFASAYGHLIVYSSWFTGETEQRGPPLTTQRMLDSAIAHFSPAISEGRGAGTATAGPQMANASGVGIARAYIQAGKLAQASAAAGSVPAGFNDNLAYVDDL